MAEGKDESEVKHSQPPLPFFEVLCKSSGKIRRFAAGTEAGFAVNLINKKLLSNGGGGGGNCLLATHVEAVKEGEEEPVSFGPNSLLVDYGSGWKLQTVIESNGNKEEVHIGRGRLPKANAHDIDDHSHPSTSGQSSPISFVYIGKIVLAFFLLFVFGAVFTLLLENLPQFILSTLHRVLSNGQDRYSIAFFTEPSHDCIVECLPTCQSEKNPPKFPPIKCQDYLLQRYKETHARYKETHADLASYQ